LIIFVLLEEAQAALEGLIALEWAAEGQEDTKLAPAYRLQREIH
jgi:hypothetical protein